MKNRMAIVDWAQLQLYRFLAFIRKSTYFLFEQMFNVDARLSSIYQQIDIFSFWTDVSVEWNKQCYIWNYQQLVMSAKSQQPKLAKTLLSGLLYNKTDS